MTVMPNTQTHFPIVAVGIALFHEGKVLLVKRARQPSQNRWAIPGGKIKPGETLQQAAEREMLEETGLHVHASRPIHAFDLIESEQQSIRFHYVIVDMLAHLLGGELHAADDASHAQWFSPQELDNDELDHNTRQFLQDNISLFSSQPS